MEKGLSEWVSELILEIKRSSRDQEKEKTSLDPRDQEILKRSRERKKKKNLTWS